MEQVYNNQDAHKADSRRVALVSLLEQKKGITTEPDTTNFFEELEM